MLDTAKMAGVWIADDRGNVDDMPDWVNEAVAVSELLSSWWEEPAGWSVTVWADGVRKATLTSGAAKEEPGRLTGVVVMVDPVDLTVCRFRVTYHLDSAGEFDRSEVEAM